MGPEVTGEAKPSPGGSPTCKTHVSGCCRGIESCSHFKHSTLSLRFGDAPGFCCKGSIGDITARRWRASVSHVLMSTAMALRRSLYCLFCPLQNASPGTVRHTIAALEVGFLQEGEDYAKACSFQDLLDFALSYNVEESAETAHVLSG